MSGITDTSHLQQASESSTIHYLPVQLKYSAYAIYRPYRRVQNLLYDQAVQMTKRNSIDGDSHPHGTDRKLAEMKASGAFWVQRLTI